MTDEIDLSARQVAEITSYVDIEAPPPDEPAALVVFGTNQQQPAVLAAGRYKAGLARLIIVTGGVNRHNGIIEGQVFRKLLVDMGVPDSVIRVEDRSANTWQNVEFSLPFLREALSAGLQLTAVSKWYHRRAVHALRTLLPEADCFYAMSWEPVYGGSPVTRESWPAIPDGRRRVIREWQEVPRRVGDGTYRPAAKVRGTWR